MLSSENRMILQYCSGIGLKKNIRPLSSIQWFDLKDKFERSQYDLMSLNDLTESELKELGIQASVIKKVLGLRRDLLNDFYTYQKDYDLQIATYYDQSLYPEILIRKMQKQAPSFFFAIGNLDLLLDQVRKMAIVGMRDCEEISKNYCEKVVEQCIENDICIVSGGARGIDQIAQETVSQAQGSMIIVLPYGLLTQQAQQMIEKQKGRFLLISMEDPFQLFQGHQAFKRNALIYALSTHAIVMQAGDGSGGTWQGATQALREKLCKIGVLENLPFRGNQRLSMMGAASLNEYDIMTWFDK